ncbi:30S ribosomal protein S20, chloroplastic-like [Camellia sinensis]|uniref:30S ribosomal protein S20, chloroplastic-like n=1 Tax=Camellia sinensis TaxID=4442 RepID=UPI001035FB5B|nr:30S ribosomal protein S20, chloroplastic-like [Camellia sinensis]
MSPIVRPTRHSIICEDAPNKKADSAAKRARQAEKRRVYNKARKSEVKTRMKKLNIFLDGLMSSACIVGRRFLILNSSKDLGQRRRMIA